MPLASAAGAVATQVYVAAPISVSTANVDILVPSGTAPAFDVDVDIPAPLGTEAAAPAIDIYINIPAPLGPEAAAPAVYINVAPLGPVAPAPAIALYLGFRTPAGPLAPSAFTIDVRALPGLLAVTTRALLVRAHSRAAIASFTLFGTRTTAPGALRPALATLAGAR